MSDAHDFRATATQWNPPSLIVVTGRPGSGKTTLARSLGDAVRCPVVSRDVLKEGFVNATGEIGEPGGDIELHVSNAFFAAVRLLLDQHITVVAEAAFQHAVWASRLEPLMEIARVRIVLCEVSAELALARQVERGAADPDRVRFHHDRAVRAVRAGANWRELPRGTYAPPNLQAPTLNVETSDGYLPAFESIVAFARASDANHIS
jgi:predicted kinase